MFEWLLAALLATTGPAPSAPADPDDVPPAQVMVLPEELRQRYRAEVLEVHRQRRDRLEATARFLLAPEGLGLAYREDATHGAVQAYATREVNCLAFALLFLALADEAGLDATPLLAEETLSWHQRDGTLFRNNHVNVRVDLGPDRFLVDVLQDAVIMRRDPAPITRQRLLAHYYNNLAMAAMHRGDTGTAQRHMALSLRLAPDYAPHWSNAGVLQGRLGDDAEAARAFARALSLDHEMAIALFNLASLAHRQGDLAAEADYRERLVRVQDKDPFHHFLRANEAQAAGDLPTAIAHYRRAIRLHGGEHRFYAALAATYLQAGETRLARKAYARAAALSEGEVQPAYRDRAAALR